LFRSRADGRVIVGNEKRKLRKVSIRARKRSPSPCPPGNNVWADKALNSTNSLTSTAAFGVSYLNPSMNVAGTITIQFTPPS